MSDERHDMLNVSTPAGPAGSLALAASITAAAPSRPGSNRRTGVALVDEFPLRRASTLNLLRTHIRDGALPFSNVEELLNWVPTDGQSLCCVVICVGGRSVAEVPLPEQLQRVLRALGSTPVIILSDREEPDEAIAAFRQGVRGYIPTSLEPCLAIEALRIVLAGGAFVPADALIRSHRRPLTAVEELPCASEVSAKHREKWPPRQLAVLRMLGQGKANKEIARALMMEETTVKVHVRHIIGKLGVRNRTQAALYARRHGFAVAEGGAGASISSTSRSGPVISERSDEAGSPSSSGAVMSSGSAVARPSGPGQIAERGIVVTTGSAPLDPIVNGGACHPVPSRHELGTDASVEIEEGLRPLPYADVARSLRDPLQVRPLDVV